jgi:hypothetical protein
VTASIRIVTKMGDQKTMRIFQFAASLLLLLSCAGCVPNSSGTVVAQAGVPSIQELRANGGCSNITGDQIASDTYMLSGFDAESNGGQDLPGGSYKSPVFGPGDQASMAIRNAIALALGGSAQASQPVRTRICSDINYIFVDARATMPYAFWETDKQAATAGHAPPWTFIGIPARLVGLLVNGGLKNSTLEAFISRALINSGQYRPSPSYDVTVQSTPDDAQTAMLSIIAHEEGHIVAHKFLLGNSGPPSNTCRGGIPFGDLTWMQVLRPPAFHRFNSPTASVHKFGDPTPLAVALATRGGTADQTYAQLFLKGNFVSLFAALAPDEDVAETFKYYVLMHYAPTPLTSLVITYPGGTSSSVIDSFGNGKSTAKLQCIQDNMAD